MGEQNLTKLLGQRILSEANDLKRTVSSLAREIKMDEGKLTDIIQGKCDLKDTHEVINLMGKHYPIDISDMCFEADDCTHSVRIMRKEDSQKSSRTFNRKDKKGEKTPYYEYRDTAMSRLGPFKPEWIRELRVVDNDDPHNPDVAYNNGHSLHQMTFFIGPVNFYWEVQGKKYCRKMNTGDSNYITPFWPHSFSSRNKNELALIIAVTFGGDVRRAQKELYMMGEEGIRQYYLPYREHARATLGLIRQHMVNEHLTFELLKDIAKVKAPGLNLDKLGQENPQFSVEELSKMAACLNVELKDLLIPEYKEEDEVHVKHKENDKFYPYPGKTDPQYKIWPLARSSKMPLMKGFDIEIIKSKVSMENPLVSSLHSYLYNYGTTPVLFSWISKGKTYQEEIHPDDSIYIQPFIPHAFFNQEKENGKFIAIRVSGSLNLATQIELSYFPNVDRVIESKCWFD